MASLNLYIDTSSNTLLSSLGPGNPVALNPTNLPLFVGDTLSLSVYLLEPVANPVPSQFNYSIIPTTGLQLFMFLDNGELGDGQVIYTQYFSWLTDPANQFFFTNPEASPYGFPLNTAALVELLGTSDSASCFLDIAYVQNGVQTTVYHQAVRVVAGAPEFELTVPPPLTPLSLQVANQLYWLNNPAPGAAIKLVSPLGKILWLRAVDNGDGTASFQSSPGN